MALFFYTKDKIWNEYGLYSEQNAAHTGTDTDCGNHTHNANNKMNVLCMKRETFICVTNPMQGKIVCICVFSNRARQSERWSAA